MKSQEPLYHYCSLETFLSILRNKTIRLSDIQKSNDMLETKALLDYISQRAITELNGATRGQLIYGVDNEIAIEHLVKYELNRILNSQDTLLYAACFSEDGDLLSQWRGYADDGKGVSIGFYPELLESIDDTMLKLGKVNYVDALNSEIPTPHKAVEYADILCEKMAYMINKGQIGNMLNGEGQPIYATLFDFEIFRDSILFKHASFREEQEWRLVLNDELNKIGQWDEQYNWEYDEEKKGFTRIVPNALQFRSIGDDIISFMDVSFHKGEKYDVCEAIASIVIGPNCKLQYADVYQILQHFNFDPESMDIHPSKSSYRAKV